jgi:putative lipase involved disintegration of autophagic bodies
MERLESSVNLQFVSIALSGMFWFIFKSAQNIMNSASIFLTLAKKGGKKFSMVGCRFGIISILLPGSYLGYLSGSF